ncbi:helix-turn-helix domain-containing protein [Nocardiopsis lambiniae]|uniref:Helix-turn-helix transcriptional regulator n=1 Tax=Nocardiopsis lambiniae TaxID=3075539 RepID=A0ABU2M686_9ACTN|nr:helix-turn-helix transcriptional regulator [Nocardiopsis sp. DSM 44743]MDT0328147.1 helix-turn-helix transcriptional regulator [Nocardiopsis sp. DSM 44743]
MAIPESFHQDRAELADRLRRLRAVSGMSGTRVAELLGWSQSKVSKIETGKVTPSGEDVRSLLDLYRPEVREREALEVLSRTLGERHRSLLMLRKRGLDKEQRTIQRVESSTRVLRVFEPSVVPGLLQSAEYARAVFSRPLSASGIDATKAMNARIDRQARLFDPDHRFHFVITEAALRWRMGGAATMVGQMDRLANLSTLVNVRLGLLPWDVEVPELPNNGFDIRDDREVAVEGFTTHRLLTDPRDVRFHLDVFQLFADAAVYDDEARAFLAELAREHA